MSMTMPKVRKAEVLLQAHKTEVIEALGASAFDLLTPAEVKSILGIVDRELLLFDLVRQGWLDFVPGKDVGNAHQYYRWRVEFVKRYRGTYKK